MFNEFPKWLYPEGSAPVLVHDADQEAAVLKAKPTKAERTTAPAADAADPLAGMDDAAVRAFAKDNGLKITGLHLMKGATLRAKVTAALG